MSLEFCRQLEQLASLDSSDYLSTKPGLTGTPLLGGTLYKHAAIESVFGGRVPCRAEEKEEITSIIKEFLEKAEKEMESKDLFPWLSTIEFLMIRMGMDENHVIAKIHDRIWNRFLSQISPQEETPGQELSPLKEKEVRKMPPKAFATEESSLPQHLQPIAIQKAPSSPQAAELIERTKEMGLSLGALVEELRTVNTCWLLNLPLTDLARTDCVKLTSELYKKSLTQSPVTDAEWIALARGISLLMHGNSDENTLKMAQETFFRFYLRQNKNTSLPEEFLSLLKNISKDSAVRNQISFFRSAALPPTAGTEQDPNASLALSTLLDEYAAFRWEDNPITITGFTSERPWKQEGEGGSDQEIVSKMCHELDVKSLSNNLDTVSLILLFALSSHTFRENPAFKKDFRKIAKHFPALLKTLGKNPPKDAAETTRYNNFRRLYQFFAGSKFLTRIAEEERAKGSVAKNKEQQKEQAPVALGERFSLWGFKKKGSRELAGNLQKEFTLTDLQASLEDVRQVAIRESKQKTQGRNPSIGEHFALLPSPLILLQPPEQKYSWGELFHEPVGDPKAVWAADQEKARLYAEEISKTFQKQTPPIDFKAVVEAVYEGKDSLKKLLQTYDDGGLVLLRDYVYPYVVLTRRATTPFEHTAAKFIGEAVSPLELASLGGEKKETQVAVLKNALHLMRPARGSDTGGFLKESVIRSNQVDMLSKMTRCIELGKTVSICNETGSGKTTMAKLAPEIVSFHVPMVLHVAPFTQSEKGWKRFTSWESLSSLGKKETTHLWITAADLAKLMENGVPKKHQATLRKTFFLMDEYDNEAYSVPSKDASGCITTSTLQDELFFQYGCPRVVNMSATPNLETLDNSIAHYKMKMAETASLPDRKDLQDYYTKKTDELSKNREDLISNITREWQRNIKLRNLPDEKDPLLQIGTVFKDLQQFPLDRTKGASLLVEMPQFILSTEFTEVLKDKMTETFAGTPSAILFRDSDGLVQAHFTKDGKTWEASSLEDFTKSYLSAKEKPAVVCFYAQDSVGGDFGIFSNERLVKGQFIVYPGEIAPSYAIFQNMRRQRTNLSSQDPERERPASPTPVHFYLGSKAATLLDLSPEEKAHIDEFSEKERAAETNLLKKEKLFNKATITATRFSRLREIARLKKKVVRKKQHLLTEILKVDEQALSRELEKTIKGPDLKQATLSFFKSKIFSVAEDISISFETDVEELRKCILTQALSSLQEPIFESMAKDVSFQENEAMVALAEIFGGNEGLTAISSSEDPYDAIQKIMTKLYGKRPPSCTALFAPAIEAIAKKKNDSMLHPAPSLAAVSAALQRVRGNAPEGIPAVDDPIDAGPVRHGVKPLPPDQMVKALLGLSFHDKLGAKGFCTRLLKEASKARAYQEDQRKILEEKQAVTEAAKKAMMKHVETISTPEGSPALPPLATLARDEACREITKKAQQMELYLNTYRLYAQQASAA